MGFGQILWNCLSARPTSARCTGLLLSMVKEEIKSYIWAFLICGTFMVLRNQLSTFLLHHSSRRKSKKTENVYNLCSKHFPLNKLKSLMFCASLILIVHSTTAQASLVCGVVEPNSASYETVLRILSSIWPSPRPTVNIALAPRPRIRLL